MVFVACVFVQTKDTYKKKYIEDTMIREHQQHMREQTSDILDNNSRKNVTLNLLLSFFI